MNYLHLWLFIKSNTILGSPLVNNDNNDNLRLTVKLTDDRIITSTV